MTKEIIDTYGRRIIRGDDLLVMLRRVEAGEHPNIVFADCWASLERPQDPAEPGEGA